MTEKKDTKKSRSIITSLPIEKFNLLIDRLGLGRAWYSVMATHLKNLERKELSYILEEKEFQDVKNDIQEYDFLFGLTVGEISALYEYSLAYTNREQRKNEGQYFTPDDVAQMMAKKTDDFSKGKIWIDPCSGVGNLSYWLAARQNDPEDFLKKNLILVDRDALALGIARFIFAVNFQKTGKNSVKLYHALKSRCIIADFLSAKADKLPRYDFALLNPPYVGVEPDYRFETAEARDRYAYFLEKIMRTASGFVSITPQTFTNGRRFLSFRKLLIQSFDTIKIYCFDNVPDNIFRGIKFGSTNSNKANSTRAGIIVAKNPAREGGEKSFAITPLLRWRVHERQKLLDSVDDFLAEVSPRAEVFPKIQKDLLPLYKLSRAPSASQKMLAHMVSPRRTPHMLIVPSTPRYFISALKNPVERSSFRTLYFYTAEERDTAYAVLNSSYMYWWWRVNDGGMTISEKTLLSLPILGEVPLDTSLLSKIERSETTHRVVKRNAGKDNENVKHDFSLINEINEKLFPRFAKVLAGVHSNSVFTQFPQPVLPV